MHGLNAKGLEPLTLLLFEFVKAISAVETPDCYTTLTYDESQFTVVDVPVDRLTPELREEVRDTVSPFAKMCSGNWLGTIYVTKHHIELEKDAKPFRSHQYHEGPNDRNVEHYKVHLMLK